MGPDAANRRRSDGDSVREQARALLQGKERWRPMWVDFGPPREVEVGMEETADGEGAGAVDVPLKRGEV